MSDQSLRDALEQVLATTDGWAVSNETLLNLLRDHPAKPVGVSDEAVEAAKRVYWEQQAGCTDGLSAMRAALEAAQPFMQPQVVASRERLAQVLDPDAFDESKPKSKQHAAVLQWAARQHMAYEGADRLLAAGVFREPPTRKQVRQVLDDLTSLRDPQDDVDEYTDKIMALMGGAE